MAYGNNNGNGNGTGLRPVRAGERTKAQIGALRAATNWFKMRGYTDVDTAFPATVENWDIMMRNPTIALGMAVKIAPILASKWSWKVKPGTPNGDQIKEWVKGVFDKLRTALLTEMMRALGLGCQSIELVWEVESENPLPGVPDVRWEIRKIKPLSRSLTRVQTEMEHGRFAGIINNGVELGPGEVLHYVFDMRDGNWYGRPLLENLRREYYEMRQDAEERQKLIKKLSAIIPMAKVLRGLAKDANGDEVDRFTVALELIKNLAAAKGVVFESVLSDEADLRANPELLKISDMDLSVLDLGSTTPAIASMLDWKKQYQQEFMQGLLLPPRTALEAQFGSRADAEEQGDVGEIHTELVHQHATCAVNWYAVDPMLVYNFGEKYRGAVYAEAAPIRDKNRALLKAILDKLLTNAATVDTIMSLMDDQQVLEQLGVPLNPNPQPVVNPLPTQQPPPANVPVPAANRIGQNYAQANKALAASRQTRKRK